MPGLDAWNGYGCRIEDRLQIWAELTPGQRRWLSHREKCLERHEHYERMKQMTTNNVVTAEGVVEAGPDEPALARATQREEVGRAMAMGSAGAVDPVQAGVSFGTIPVTDAMVERGHRAAADTGLVPSQVRAILKAALNAE